MRILEARKDAVHWTTGERLSWPATAGIAGAPLFYFPTTGMRTGGTATPSCEKDVYC